MRLQDIIRELSKSNEEVYSVIGTVEAVNGNTIDVKPINGDAMIFDVRLQASEQFKKGLQIIPAKGSEVIISFISKNLAYVTAMTQIDGVAIHVNGKELSTTLESMIDAISSLASIVEKLQIVTPTGPGTVNPANVTELITFKNKDLRGLKRDLNTILKESK